MNRNSLRLEIAKQSRWAPGLPANPRIPMHSHAKSAPVSSVNYDYLATEIDAPKTLWVDLVTPAPRDMLVGTICRLQLAPNRGIQTQLHTANHLNSMFEIGDIIGTRVILLPYKGSTWLPTVHSSCDNPFGWGYNMQRINVGTNMHGTSYGYGVPLSSLEYFPYYYSKRATQFDAVRQEDDYYRQTGKLPGWGE